MHGTKEPTILTLLGPSLTVRRISKPRPERWFLRQSAKLSDRLLANAVVWPGDLKGYTRHDRSHRFQ
jgi:hypothetical protein